MDSEATPAATVTSPKDALAELQGVFTMLAPVLGCVKALADLQRLVEREVEVQRGQERVDREVRARTDELQGLTDALALAQSTLDGMVVQRRALAQEVVEAERARDEQLAVMRVTTASAVADLKAQTEAARRDQAAALIALRRTFEEERATLASEQSAAEADLKTAQEQLQAVTTQMDELSSRLRRDPDVH